MMFAVTQRLLLRPGWQDDAPVLARKIADEKIVRNLARAPWPYGLEEAAAHLERMQTAELPSFLITRRDNADIIGACGFGYEPSGEIEFGYWIARDHWGQGYATEAGRAALDISRTLGWDKIVGGHFIDNPASGRVLEKLGFVPTGARVMRHSCGRGGEAMCELYSLDLNGAVARTEAAAA
ncbi:GNAT family N-acetyltransferase [Sphingomicrobium sediminis]|uniref:GNAT family N-acetyltransferase n=1 Tax=Sphingomicrobium sediminis TaxID=2950949 RepID=A0A9X2EI72_9SPHN|nr:GNAT family N-acetyltransferase [Sphingomicrobium sediminis]MCM8558513.1 GNAT family N-acetyltransferase [Sphingomicrobium sediminis]